MAFGKIFNSKKNSDKKSNPTPSTPAAPLVEIGRLLSAQTIIFPEKVEKKSDLLKKLVETLSQAYPDVPVKTAFQAVMEREKVTSTFMDSGIAVPHARLPKISQIRTVLGVMPPSVRNANPQEDPTRVQGISFVFLFVSPEKDFTGHLQTLSRASWLFQNQTLREQLLGTQTPQEALDFIRHAEKQATHGPTA